MLFYFQLYIFLFCNCDCALLILAWIFISCHNVVAEKRNIVSLLETKR